MANEELWQPTNLDEIEKERTQLADERAASKARQGRMQLQVGKNVVRVLPGRKGQKSPFYRVWLHYVKNPATPGKNGRPLPCPLKNSNKPCVICKTVGNLRRSNNPLDAKAANDLSASRRIYANVVDMSAPDKGPQALEFGVKIYEDLLALMNKDPNDPSSVGDITHPDTGYNIVIEKAVGDPNNLRETTDYKVRAAKAPTVIADKKWLTAMKDLTQAIEGMTDEKVQALLEGRSDDTEFPPADEGSTAGSVNDDLYDAPPAKG